MSPKEAAEEKRRLPGEAEKICPFPSVLGNGGLLNTRVTHFGVFLEKIKGLLIGNLPIFSISGEDEVLTPSSETREFIAK